LKDAQQLGLQADRHFANFVKKHRAALAAFQAAALLNHRAREGSFFMAEQFAFRGEFPLKRRN